MKKFVWTLLMIFVIFTLTSCESPEEKNEREFKEYLSTSEKITIEKLDQQLQSDNADIPLEMITDIYLENTHLEVVSETSDGTSNGDGYFWQNENKIYVAGIEGNDNICVFFDLNEIKSLFEGAENSTTNMKPSEIIDSMLEESLAESGIDLDLEKLLEIINVTYDDFEMVELGKYSIKEDVLIEKLAKIMTEEVSTSELKELIKASGYKFSVYVYFDGEHINGFESSIKVAQSGLTLTMGFKFMLNYVNGVINGISIEANIPMSADIKAEFKNEEGEFKFDINVLAYQTTEGLGSGNITVKGAISSSKLELVCTSNNVELINCKLNVATTDSKINLSGTVKIVNDIVDNKYNYITMNITSGSQVNIPSNVKALESTAINGLEASVA